MSNKSGSSLVVVKCFCGHTFKVVQAVAQGVFTCPRCEMSLTIFEGWLYGKERPTRDEMATDESAEVRLGVI